MISSILAWNVAGQTVSPAVGTVLSPVHRQLLYGVNATTPNVVPSPQDLIRSYLGGNLKTSTLEKLLGFHGILASSAVHLKLQYKLDGMKLAPESWIDTSTSDPWQAVLQANEFIPPLQLTIDMLNRGIISEQSADWWMRRLGIPDPLMRSTIRGMRYTIPGPHEVMRLATREAFADAATIEKLGLDLEYPEEYAKWAKAAGWWKVAVPSSDGKSVDHYDFARGLWRAHWTIPSLGQAFDMYHRLRPTGGIGGGPRDPSGLVFDGKKLDAILKMSGFSPLYRRELGAISFRPVSQRFLVRSIRYGLLEEGETVEYLKDNGYNDRDSRLMAKTLKRDADLSGWLNAAKLARTKIEEALRIGVIDDATAKTLFMGHGLTDDEAGMAVDAVKLEITNGVTKSVIAGIKSKVYHGWMTLTAAGDKLSAMGISDFAKTNYLAEWGDWLDGPHAKLMAGKVCELVGKGLLLPADGLKRLENLGYTHDDALLYIGPCIQAWEGRLSKAAMAAIKSAEKKAREAAKAIRDKKRAIQDAQRELARHSSPAMIKRWLSEGLIFEGDAIKRLTALGWPADDIKRLVEEAALAAAKKAVKPSGPKPKPKPPASPVSG